MSDGRPSPSSGPRRREPARRLSVPLDPEENLRGLLKVEPGAGSLVTETTITCPLCGTQAREAMPENACQHLYRCTGCGELLKPKPGDYCVFCSYADSACPPKQESQGTPATDRDP